MSLKGKRVLVTGACGTVGSELIKCLIQKDCEEILGLDNNESELFFIDQEYKKYENVNFFLCDVSKYENFEGFCEDIDIIFHAAALKHVILCEKTPKEAVSNNILGVQNIISAARRNKVSKVIFTSSDKAVNPTNVMGTTKLMGERLITAANSSARPKGPIFSSTRFGNVLGSSGSVIPIFRQQIENGGPVTVTDYRMTRFIMTINEAAKLVLDSHKYAKGGEVFITKMPVIRIIDLAEVMIEEIAPEYGFDPKSIEIKEIGAKPGEKLYEELMSEEETRRAVELTEYFSVLPAFRSVYKDINYDYVEIVEKEVNNPYISSAEPALTKEELKEFLILNKLL